jgi:Flp pilus assembly CpaE family ATPase
VTASSQMSPPEPAEGLFVETEVADPRPLGLAAAPAHRGTVVAVAGSKGGCGVTTLVVNLGAELAVGRRVCLIDLAGSQGDIAAYLDLDCEHEVSELAELEDLDATLLQGVATSHRSGLVVLPQPTDMAQVRQLDSAAVRRVLEACRLAYDVVLVDCNTRVDEATLSASMLADVVVLVATPDVPAVRDAHRHLRLLDRLHVDRDRVRLVLNQGSRHQQLSVAEIEDQLNHEVAAVVRADPAVCARSQLTGRLLRELPGRSRADDDISRLWPALVGEAAGASSRRGTLASWLRTRLSLEAK